MTDKEVVLSTLKRAGKVIAQEIQEKAPSMSSTELYADELYIPTFDAAIEKDNMLNREPGFVCISAQGHVVKLLQKYDSSVYTQQPEDLPAQWGFKWSTDPKRARPFIAISTSPYMNGDCCTYEGFVWQSGQDSNVWAPGTQNVKWTKIGTIKEIIGE